MYNREMSNRVALKKIFCAAVLLFLIGAGATACSSSNPEPVDLSDIDEMNIGSEMPLLVYGDSDTIILYGACGMIIYDTGSRTVTDRVLIQEMTDQRIRMPDLGASLDGKSIYIGNLGESYQYRYDVSKHSMEKYDGKDVDIFKTISVVAGYEETYDSYFDLKYLIGGNIIVDDERVIHLRAKTDWSMKSLQIVITDRKTNQESVYDVFGADNLHSDFVYPEKNDYEYMEEINVIVL